MIGLQQAGFDHGEKSCFLNVGLVMLEPIIAMKQETVATLSRLADAFREFFHELTV
jgi:hypothetical protein